MIRKKIFLLFMGGLFFYHFPLQSGIKKIVSAVALNWGIQENLPSSPLMQFFKKISGNALNFSGAYFLFENVYNGNHVWTTGCYAALCTLGTHLIHPANSIECTKRYVALVGATTIATQALRDHCLFSEHIQTVFASCFFTKSIIEFFHALYDKNSDKALTWLAITAIACSCFSHKNIIALLDRDNPGPGEEARIGLMPNLYIRGYIAEHPLRNDFAFSIADLKFFKRAQEHAQPFAMRIYNRILNLVRKNKAPLVMSQNYFILEVLPYLSMKSRTYLNLSPSPYGRPHAPITVYGSFDLQSDAQKAFMRNIPFNYIYPFICEENFRNYLKHLQKQGIVT